MRLDARIVPITKLEPNPWNVNQMGEREYGAARESIRESGFVDPITVRRHPAKRGHWQIIDGEQRWKAAKDEGWTRISINVLDVEDVAARKLTLQLNNKGAADPLRLAQEIAALQGLLGERAGIGLPWTAAELQQLVALSAARQPSERDDDVPPLPAEPVTRPRDLILLGRHRLLCGDATNEAELLRLMGGGIPGFAFVDPPYGIAIVRHSRRKVGEVGSGGRFRGSIGSGNIIPSGSYEPVIGDETPATAIASYRLLAKLGIPVLIFWGANHYAEALPSSPSWIVWDKREGQPGNNFADCELAWTNQSGAVRIFRHLWNGLMKATERGERRVHPTQKPVALARWCFERYGKADDIVLDPFSGSGSALIAAEAAGRVCCAAELSPGYCDVIVARWEKFTGQRAIRPERAHA